jgi:hypothetical protein
METASKRKLKAKIKKAKSKNVAIKLMLVFGPLLFFLVAYLVTGLYFGYATKHHNRMEYPKKVSGMLNSIKQTFFESEKPKQNNIEAALQD